MANYEPTPMRFSTSTSDRLDLRRRPPSRRFGSLLSMVVVLGAAVGAFVWFASGATERTTAQIAADPVVTTLPAPASN